jgi:Arc/MetJ-type ribon-helix-helix transcriptional regulator
MLYPGKRTAMIDFSPENEEFIEELVAAGRFENRNAVVDEAVRRLRDELEANGHDRAEHLSVREWCERFDKWAASHRALPHKADDSRQSIYAGRGE